MDFIDKYTNEKGFIPKNTIINKSKSLANGTEIRDLKRLLNNYGGNPDDWSKKFGMVKSAKYKYDIHWYEKHGKQYESKFKNRKEI